VIANRSWSDGTAATGLDIFCGAGATIGAGATAWAICTGAGAWAGAEEALSPIEPKDNKRQTRSIPIVIHFRRKFIKASVY